MMNSLSNLKTPLKLISSNVFAAFSEKIYEYVMYCLSTTVVHNLISKYTNHLHG